MQNEFNDSFNYSMLSAIPKTGSAILLHNSYKARLIISLKKLIKYSAKKLNENYSLALDKIDSVEKTTPPYLSPWLYHKYFKILAAMENDGIDEVKEILNLLVNGEYNYFYKDKLTIQAGLQQEWEHDIFKQEMKTSLGLDTITTKTPSQIDFLASEIEINKALEIITTADPVFNEEITSLVSEINIINCKHIAGSTSPKFFGAIYISLPQGALENDPVLHFIEHIVHETSHLYLNTIIAYDKLVLNDPFQLYSAPIRKDARPMLGVYHATFVLSRMIRIFKKISELNLYPDREIVNSCITDFTQKYEKGCSSIITQGVLTELGEKIFLSTKACALLN